MNSLVPCNPFSVSVVRIHRRFQGYIYFCDFFIDATETLQVDDDKQHELSAVDEDNWGD
jgi:hypothetical protein